VGRIWGHSYRELLATQMVETRWLVDGELRNHAGSVFDVVAGETAVVRRVLDDLQEVGVSAHLRAL